jgi:4-hydroxyproline epimerase
MQPNSRFQYIHVIDSHTAGEPTRVVTQGGPDLGGGSVLEQLHRLETQHDSFRTAVINEPRGSDVLIGALLCKATEKDCAAGVIFFNNAGYLGMCGHGTIGLMVTLAHTGKIGPGSHRIETPVGVVTAALHANGRVTLDNVPSYRSHKDVVVNVSGIGNVRGDVAWGGNWFFLTEDHTPDLTLENTDELTEYAWKLRLALKASNITGGNGAEIDHIEIFTPCRSGDADSDNFVLCPGKAYDRSPCGTGTGAKLACLHADGKLQVGQVWRQRGILGTIFEGTIALQNGLVIPSITGSAYITAESTLVLDIHDPFRAGIPR